MAVYFLRAGEDGPVKIGYATNVSRRVAVLRAGYPGPLMVLRVYEPGTRYHEAWLHQNYAAQRVHGEWFRYSGDMLSIEPKELLPVTVKPVFASINSEHRRIIEMWPTAAALAREIGVDPQAVVKWRARSRIPGWYFTDLIAAAERRGYSGVTAEALAAAASRSQEAA